jgi:hypothetical protein
MSTNIFEKGEPLNVRRISKDKYEIRISIPVDEDGMVGRWIEDTQQSPWLQF